MSEKVRNNHPYHVWESINKIPGLLAECLADKVKMQAIHVADEILRREIDHIFLLGSGSSYFASTAEQYAFQKISRLDAQSYVSGIFKTYPPISLSPKATVFFHSHSGNTEGDLESFNLAKEHGAYTIGVTDISSSALAEAVDDVFIGPGGAKVEKPATRTYATALMRMILLSIYLGKLKGNLKVAESYEENIQSLPEIARELILGNELLCQNVVDIMEGCEAFIILGYGPNRATADEAAMAFCQSTGIPSQSYEMDNFIHGPIQGLKINTGVFVIAAPGELQDKAVAVAHACQIIGAKVILLTEENYQNVPVGVLSNLRIRSGIFDLLSPIVYMIPFWQIAYAFSLLGRGAHPDRLSMDKPEYKRAFQALMKSDQWLHT